MTRTFKQMSELPGLTLQERARYRELSQDVLADSPEQRRRALNEFLEQCVRSDDNTPGKTYLPSTTETTDATG